MTARSMIPDLPTGARAPVRCEGTARAPVDKSTCPLLMQQENRRLPVLPMSPDSSVTYLPDRSRRPGPQHAAEA